MSRKFWLVWFFCGVGEWWLEAWGRASRACWPVVGRAACSSQILLDNFTLVRKSRGRGPFGRARACDDSDPSFDTHSRRPVRSRLASASVDLRALKTRRAATVLHIWPNGRSHRSVLLTVMGLRSSCAPCVGNKKAQHTTPTVSWGQTEHRRRAGLRTQPYDGCAARPAPAAPLFRPRDALSTAAG